MTMLNVPRGEEGFFFGFFADVEPDPYAGFRLAFASGAVSNGVAVAALVASRETTSLNR